MVVFRTSVPDVVGVVNLLELLRGSAQARGTAGSKRPYHTDRGGDQHLDTAKASEGESAGRSVRRFAEVDDWCD